MLFIFRDGTGKESKWTFANKSKAVEYARSKTKGALTIYAIKGNEREFVFGRGGQYDTAQKIEYCDGRHIADIFRNCPEIAHDVKRDRIRKLVNG